MTEVRVRQILTHKSSPGECASSVRCSRGLVSPPNARVAVPFEQELGMKGPPGSLATERERIKQAKQPET